MAHCLNTVEVVRAFEFDSCGHIHPRAQNGSSLQHP